MMSEMNTHRFPIYKLCLLPEVIVISYIFQVHEAHIDHDIIKSKMEIDPTTQMDAGKCHFIPQNNLNNV